MLGLGQIRAYKTLAKPVRNLPSHTKLDVRLFRVISWGAFVYFAAMLGAYLIVHNFVMEITATPAFPAVIPIAIVLLICWWTTDMAPRFARWSILVLSATTILIAGGFTLGVDTWTIIELALLVVYLLLVAGEAGRQLILIRHSSPIIPDR